MLQVTALAGKSCDLPACAPGMQWDSRSPHLLKCEALTRRHLSRSFSGSCCSLAQEVLRELNWRQSPPCLHTQFSSSHNLQAGVAKAGDGRHSSPLREGNIFLSSCIPGSLIKLLLIKLLFSLPESRSYHKYLSCHTKFFLNAPDLESRGSQREGEGDNHSCNPLLRVAEAGICSPTGMWLLNRATEAKRLHL